MTSASTPGSRPPSRRAGSPERRRESSARRTAENTRLARKIGTKASTTAASRRGTTAGQQPRRIDRRRTGRGTQRCPRRSPAAGESGTAGSSRPRPARPSSTPVNTMRVDQPGRAEQQGERRDRPGLEQQERRTHEEQVGVAAHAAERAAEDPHARPARRRGSARAPQVQRGDRPLLEVQERPVVVGRRRVRPRRHGGTAHRPVGAARLVGVVLPTTMTALATGRR